MMKQTKALIITVSDDLVPKINNTFALFIYKVKLKRNTKKFSALLAANLRI